MSFFKQFTGKYIPLIQDVIFREVILTDEYMKEWNISNQNHKFGMLYSPRNGKLSNEIFRIGGLSTFKSDEKYMQLLLQVESFYSDEIMKMSKIHKVKETTNKHLSNTTVIVDANGEIKASFNSLSYPNLIGGILYIQDGKCYNIETEEMICNVCSSAESKEYIFIEDRYNKEKTKRGVYQIQLETGNYILHRPKK